MTRILLIETSTERGVVACSHRGTILFCKELPIGLHQSKYVMPAVEEVYKIIGREVEVIGVGIGPGSYTGIRIGAAIAQGLSYAWKVPIVRLSSLSGFVPKEHKGPFASVIDARMGGIYFQRGIALEDRIVFEEQPQMCPVDAAAPFLAGRHIVTPMAKDLQRKFDLQSDSSWEERGPCAEILFRTVEEEYKNKNWIIPPASLELLYLKKTEAERNREQNLA